MAEHLDSVNGVKICSVHDAKEFTGPTENTAQISSFVYRSFINELSCTTSYTEAHIQ